MVLTDSSDTYQFVCFWILIIPENFYTPNPQAIVFLFFHFFKLTPCKRLQFTYSNYLSSLSSSPVPPRSAVKGCCILILISVFTLPTVFPWSPVNSAARDLAFYSWFSRTMKMGVTSAFSLLSLNLLSVLPLRYTLFLICNYSSLPYIQIIRPALSTFYRIAILIGFWFGYFYLEQVFWLPTGQENSKPGHQCCCILVPRQ